jgi:hypothetical protein
MELRHANPASKKPGEKSRMSLITKLSNKVTYSLDQAVSDPKADEYAKQQEKQRAQDEKVKKREEEAKLKKEADDKRRAEAKAKQEDIAKRSKFDTGQLISDAAYYILVGSIVLIAVLIASYGGSIAANAAIGYSIPNRLLAFMYGAIMSWYLVPKTLYEIFILGNVDKSYCFLTLSQYVPNGFAEELFLGPFCYKEDDASRQAAEKVRELYEKGAAFLKITKNQ